MERERAALLARTTASQAAYERAVTVMPRGVPSSFQAADPRPVYLSHGEGSRVWDVDGNEYVDFHNGYGAMAVGHAHPRIVEVVSERVRLGTHFAQPTEDAIVVAEELARRFGLPSWRFGNSGTEATMDAVHLMRAVTGRDLIVKVEGTYHGHHDSVQVSVYQLIEELGPSKRPWSAPASSGIPSAIVELTLVTPFNDPEPLRALFADRGKDIAGMIMEPVMMNAGIIPPVPGWLECAREVTREHGALLAFDEVKTGSTIHPGGATARFGVTPDIVCLAKAMGGGISTAAIGGTEEVMSFVADGAYEQVGTFNGNPLAMAAARAALTEVLTPEAYAHFDGLRETMVAGCEGIIEEHGLPAHVVALGAKGCIVFSAHPIRNYRDFLEIDDRFSHLHWLMQHAGGVFLPPWGKAEQWMLSVQHSQDDVGRFLDNFARFAGAIGGDPDASS
ncbi:MAG TPA: aspartate aminotransferase family protein [Actinomycetota bacterium]|nr:aspartate aminotransferase family protein [Actinomycetota bacterium]